MLAVSTTIDLTQIILALIAGFPAAVAALGVLYVTLTTQRVVKEESAKQTLVANEVKSTLEDTTHRTDASRQETKEKIAELSKVVDSTHVLINSNFQGVLEERTKALRDIYDKSGKQTDKDAADVSQRELDRHNEGQREANKAT